MISKKCAVSFDVFAIFTAISFITLYIMSLFAFNKWVGVIAAACVLFVAVMFTLKFGRFYAKVAIIGANAISCGLAASSVFVYAGGFPPIWQAAALWAAYCALFLFYILLCNLSFFRNHPAICIGIYSLIILGGAISGTAFGLKIFYLAALFWIVFAVFLAACAIKADGMYAHVKNLTICSFAVAIVVIIVVLIILSQGDGLDGLGGGLDGGLGVKEKRKYNPYSFGELI